MLVGSIAAFVFATDKKLIAWFKSGSQPDDYNMGITDKVAYKGKHSGYIESKGFNPKGFATLMQTMSPEKYLGKRVKMHWAGMWMRVDGENKALLSFDNMQNRAIKGTQEWNKYGIVLDVYEDSKDIAFGILLEGKGKVWLDEVTFTKVDKSVPTTDSVNRKKANDKEEGNLGFEE